MKLVDTPADLITRRAPAVRDAFAQGRAVASPCISVCRMDARTGLCEGCYRTLDEVAAWSGLDDEGRMQIWAEIEHRVHKT